MSAKMLHTKSVASMNVSNIFSSTVQIKTNRSNSAVACKSMRTGGRCDYHNTILVYFRKQGMKNSLLVSIGIPILVTQLRAT